MVDTFANGVRFNVVRLGTSATSKGRPTVVFVHGLIMDNLSSFYYTIAPGVSVDADVVLYDLRGHGRTERPGAGYAIDDAVDDLVGILDALHLPGPVFLAGNSFGGTVALAMALCQPERVAGIVLIEGHPVVEGWGDEVISHLEQIVSGLDDPGVREWIASAGRKMRRMSDTCEELISYSTLPQDLRASETTTAEDFATITSPVLCLYGEYSDILDRGRALEAALPNCELRVLEGCTHSILMEAPEELEDHIRSWLRVQCGVGPAGDPQASGDLVAADAGFPQGRS